MYQGLLHLHNFLRWVILLLLIVNVIRHIMAMNKPFGAGDKKLGLVLMITAHVMLLIGLYQYFAGHNGFSLFAQNGASAVMRDPALRFWAVEHITSMVLAIVLITLARGVFRKPLTNEAKHKRALLLYVIALILVIAAIPWPFREAVARPLFPGM